jgi:hypothetical protein
MGAIIDMIGWQVFNIVSITSAVAYVGLVIVGYVTEGPRYQFRLDLAYPIRSAARLLIGIGVRTTVLILQVAAALVDPLIEASAQVGEWIIQQCSEETQARYRSRFI